MAIQAIGQKEKEVQTIYQTSLKKEFEEGLEEQGFVGNKSPTGNVCYQHPKIDWVFVICFPDGYEIRAFSTSTVYDVVKKKKYTGRKEGLELLYN